MSRGEFSAGSFGSDSVVSISWVRSTMQHPALAQVEAYWEGLRDGRPLPFRADVDPRGIDQALEFAFILERIAPGVARFRLAGMHLNDLMGMEVRGMPLTSFFTPEARRTLSDALEHLFEEPAKVRVKLKSTGGIGKPEIVGELLLLPLKSDLGDVSRAIGCLVSDGKVGRTPRRFDVVEINVVGLDETSKFEISVETEEPSVPAAEQGFAEGQRSFTPATPSNPTPPAPGPNKAAERPYLRLVHSNDKSE